MSRKSKGKKASNKVAAEELDPWTDPEMLETAAEETSEANEETDEAVSEDEPMADFSDQEDVESEVASRDAEEDVMDEWAAQEDDGEDSLRLESAAPEGREGNSYTGTTKSQLLRFEEALTLEGQIEALIFAAPKAVRIDEILEMVQTDDMAYSEKDIEVVLDNLVELYKERNGGFRLEVVKGAYQFQTVPAAAPLMERLFSSRPRPLSRAALETLAIIAYRQPVTRADVEFIRGVDAGSIFKNLLERNLITCVGRKEDSGRPMLFGTTPYFLEVFRLNNLKELPPLSAFQPAPETMTEAMNKLENPEGVDVEGFVADQENRELSDDELELIGKDTEVDDQTEFAPEGDDVETMDSSEDDNEEIVAAAEDNSDEPGFQSSEADGDDEEFEALSEETEEEIEAAEEAPTPPEPPSDDPFWEVDQLSRKTSQNPERVVKGASSKGFDLSMDDEEDGTDSSAEMDLAAGDSLPEGGGALDSRGKDFD